MNWLNYRWVALGGLVAALGCGSTLIDDNDSDSPTAGEEGDTVAEGDGDSSEGPMGGCGVGDTELIGGGLPGPTGFPLPCSPSRDPGVNGYRCCSDDPAAVGGAKPAYMGLGVSDGADPLFSEANNDGSNFGQCLRVGDIAGQGLSATGVEGCPIPCNPTWPVDWIDDVCGAARVCCQTVELGEEDCILDEATGLYRPITGADIGSDHPWRPGDHATHQDPNGEYCLTLAAGDVNAEIFQDCVRQLTVADQRGFCMALGAGQACPLEGPTYIDACEQLNAG